MYLGSESSGVFFARQPGLNSGFSFSQTVCQPGLESSVCPDIFSIIGEGRRYGIILFAKVILRLSECNELYLNSNLILEFLIRGRDQLYHRRIQNALFEHKHSIIWNYMKHLFTPSLTLSTHRLKKQLAYAACKECVARSFLSANKNVFNDTVNLQQGDLHQVP